MNSEKKMERRKKEREAHFPAITYGRSPIPYSHALTGPPVPSTTRPAALIDR